MGWIATLLAGGATLGLAGCGIFFQVGDEDAPCDLLTHAPCSAGLACVGTGAPRCVTPGTKAVGEACTLEDECVREALCDGSGSAKVCRARCDQMAPKCAAPLACLDVTNADDDERAGVCAELACEPFSGAGCPQDERCIGGPRPYCTAVIGVGGAGLSCTLSEACKPGHLCVKDGTTGSQSCVALCVADDGAGGEPAPGANGCDPGFACRGLIDGQGAPLPAAQGTCAFVFCNALTNFGCSAIEKCYPTTPPVCDFPGNGALQEVCAEAKDCGRDLICVKGSDGVQRCRQVCDVTGADAAHGCPTGEMCAEISTGQGNPPLPDHIGLCRPKT